MANIIPVRTVKLTAIEIYKEAYSKLSGAKLPFLLGIGVAFVLTFGLFVALIALLYISRAETLGNILVYISKVEALKNILEWAISILFQSLYALYFAGFFRMALRHISGHKISGLDVLYFVKGNGPIKQIIFAQFVMGVCIGIGLLFLMLPGIYLALSYALTFFLIIDREIGFWDAMESSRKAFIGNLRFLFRFFALALILSLIATIPFGLGWICFFPLYFIALAIIYEKLFGIEKAS